MGSIYSNIFIIELKSCSGGGSDMVEDEGERVEGAKSLKPNKSRRLCRRGRTGKQRILRSDTCPGGLRWESCKYDPFFS